MYGIRVIIRHSYGVGESFFVVLYGVTLCIQEEVGPISIFGLSTTLNFVHWMMID